jgi:hypothetical protein
MKSQKEIISIFVLVYKAGLVMQEEQELTV